MNRFTLSDHIFLITGATGFIGSAIARKLCSVGIEVHVLHRQNSSMRLIADLPVIKHTGDVTDRKSVEHAMKDCTAVIHCAGVVSFWRKKRQMQYRINVEGTEVVASTALSLGIKRMVHTSSIAALGPATTGEIISEETPFAWDRYDIGYNISKHESELRVIEKVKHGLDAVIVNPSTVIGPGDIHLHGSALILNVMKKRLPFYISTKMNVVDIDDVVHGHLLAFEKGVPGERYILSGHSLPLNELMVRIALIAGGKPPRLRLPYPVAYMGAIFIELAGLLFNIRPLVTRELLRVGKYRKEYTCVKAEKELGYTRTPLEETIRKTSAWLREWGLA